MFAYKIYQTQHQTNKIYVIFMGHIVEYLFLQNFDRTYILYILTYTLVILALATRRTRQLG